MSGGTETGTRGSSRTRLLTADDVTATLERCAAQLTTLSTQDPSSTECDEVMAEIAALLPDERAADLLDEVARAEVPSTMRAAAARQLVGHGVIDLGDPLVRELLAEVGPPGRLAIARGLYERGDNESARGLVRPLMRAVHDEVRQEAQLLYRAGPQDYTSMLTENILSDTAEPGWLHRAWAARELLARGDVDDALAVLDGVVGAWTFFGDEDTRAEPVRVIEALAERRDDPRARALLERASADPLIDVREAAGAALGVDVAPAPGEEHSAADIDLAAEERAEAASASRQRRFGRARR